MAWEKWTNEEQGVFVPEPRPFTRVYLFPAELKIGVGTRQDQDYTNLEAESARDRSDQFFENLKFCRTPEAGSNNERFNRAHAAASLCVESELLYLLYQEDPGREQYSTGEAIRYLEHRKSEYGRGKTVFRDSHARHILSAVDAVFLQSDAVNYREILARSADGQANRRPDDKEFPRYPASSPYNPANLVPPFDEKIEQLYDYVVEVRAKAEAFLDG